MPQGPYPAADADLGLTPHPKSWEPLDRHKVLWLYVLSALCIFIAPVWAIVWTLDGHPDRNRHGRNALALYAGLMVVQLVAWVTIASVLGGKA